MSPDSQPPPLIVAISSRALFDLEDSHQLFEREGIQAYAEHQRAHEDDVLEPGIAFPLVRKLLALNEGAAPEAPRVEVILLSRNSADTGLRGVPLDLATYDYASQVAWNRDAGVLWDRTRRRLRARR